MNKVVPDDIYSGPLHPFVYRWMMRADDSWHYGPCFKRICQLAIYFNCHSVKDLSYVLGVSPFSLEMWMRYSRRKPSNASLALMENRAGVNGKWLLTGKGEMMKRTPLDMKSQEIKCRARIDEIAKQLTDLRNELEKIIGKDW